MQSCGIMDVLDFVNNYRGATSVDLVLTRGIDADFYGYIYYVDNGTLYHRIFSFKWFLRQIIFELKEPVLDGSYNVSYHHNGYNEFTHVFQHLYTGLTE